MTQLRVSVQIVNRQTLFVADVGFDFEANSRLVSRRLHSRLLTIDSGSRSAWAFAISMRVILHSALIWKHNEIKKKCLKFLGISSRGLLCASAI